MRPARPVLARLALLALGACQPAAPQDRPTPAPAAPPPAPAAYAGDFDVRGTEPFWAVEIREGGLTLQRPGRPPAAGANPGPRTSGGGAVWSTTVDGQALAVTLREDAACSDGMSDRAYPYAAVVVFGSETWRGCAARPAPAPRARP
jgi:uncharacterized membrane protein